MWRKIDLKVDTFALIWAARRPGEQTEDEIIARLARESVPDTTPTRQAQAPDNEQTSEGAEWTSDKPISEQWVHVLVWALGKLGGEAHLSEIYRSARLAREALGKPIRRNHEATVRERLESYCSSSDNYKGIADLFWQPRGKGSGVWALKP